MSKTWTVEKLREALQHFDDDDIVILQKDAEGNGYSPLYEARSGVYAPDFSLSGSMYPHESYEGDDGANAIVLRPMG